MPTSNRAVSNDLLVVSRFKNLQLVKAIEDLGLSQHQLANNAGVNYASLCALINLQRSPFSRQYKDSELRYTKTAVKIAEYLGFSPVELFPESLYSLSLPTKVEREYASAEILPLLAARGELCQLPSGEDRRFTEEAAEAIERAMESLPTREWAVVRMRFGLGGEAEHTLEEIAEKLSVGSERIRQIEKKALRRLRHPSCSRHMRPFIEAELG